MWLTMGRKRALCLDLAFNVMFHQIAGSDFSLSPLHVSLSVLCYILVFTKTR